MSVVVGSVIVTVAMVASEGFDKIIAVTICQKNVIDILCASIKGFY